VRTSPFDHVAGVQVEAAHLRGRDVDVVGARRVAGVRAAQEAEAVRQDLQHPVGEDLFAGTRALLDDGEHQLLLAHAAGVLDLEFFGLLEDFGDVERLEFVEVHGSTALEGPLRGRALLGRRGEVRSRAGGARRTGESN
jgi:hypothetical protein